MLYLSIDSEYSHIGIKFIDSAVFGFDKRWKWWEVIIKFILRQCRNVTVNVKTISKISCLKVMQPTSIFLMTRQAALTCLLIPIHKVDPRNQANESTSNIHEY